MNSETPKKQVAQEIKQESAISDQTKTSTQKEIKKLIEKKENIHGWCHSQLDDLKEECGKCIRTIENTQLCNHLKSVSKIQNAKDVMYVQIALSKLGFDIGRIDGVYRSKQNITSKTLSNTQKAVKKFQAKNGLSADGFAGKDTLQKLYAETKKHVPPKVVKVIPKIQKKVKENFTIPEKIIKKTKKVPEENINESSPIFARVAANTPKIQDQIKTIKQMTDKEKILKTKSIAIKDIRNTLNISPDTDIGKIITKISKTTGITEEKIIPILEELGKARQALETKNPSKFTAIMTGLSKNPELGKVMNECTQITQLSGALSFLRSPIAKKLLVSLSLVGGVTVWNTLLNKKNWTGWNPTFNTLKTGNSVVDTVAYYVPFAGNMLDWNDMRIALKKGEKMKAALSGISGSIGMALDIMMLTGVGAVAQGPKIGFKMAIRKSIKALGKKGTGFFAKGNIIKNSLHGGKKIIIQGIEKMKKSFRTATSPETRKKIFTKISELAKKAELVPIIGKTLKAGAYLLKETISGIWDTLTFKSVRSTKKFQSLVNSFRGARASNAEVPKTETHEATIPTSQKQEKDISILHDKIEIAKHIDTLSKSKFAEEGLNHQFLIPIKSIKIGNQKIYLSAPLSKDGKLSAMMYIEINGTLKAQFLHKSNNDWKFDSSNQKIKPHQDIIKILENMKVKNIESAQKFEKNVKSKEENVQNSDNVISLKAKKQNNEKISTKIMTKEQIKEHIKKLQKPKITETILKDDFFAPVKNIEIDNQKFYVSQTFTQSDGRLYAMLYTEVNGSLKTRFLYKSNSDGGWRLDSPHYRGEALSKGRSKNGQYINYTQETKPHHNIIKNLDTAKGNTMSQQNLNTYENTYKSFYKGIKVDKDGAPEIVNGYYKKKYEENISDVNTDKLSNIKKDFSGGQLPDEINTAKINIDTIKNFTYPKNFIPDFTQKPLETYTKEHSLLGNIKIEVFEGELNGKKIVWDMASDKEGRVWADHIVPKEAKINSWGIYDQVMDCGILNIKPLEYGRNARNHNQAANVPDQYKKYFIKNGKKTKYDDITPFLDELTPIQEYRAQRNIYRQDEYIKAA
jgi:hypothetical protein